MTTGRVSVMNLALQMLGQERIGAPDEDRALEMNSSYDAVRDYEQRGNAWVFTLSRAILAPHAVAPAFGYGYAFPLPVGCLRVIKPNRVGVLDWKIENHEGVPAILTNEGTAIQLRFVMRVTNEAIFDPMFTMMFAASLAWQCCEKITQSNSKKEAIERRYQQLRQDARRMNAFEKVPDQAPVDDWLSAMQVGGLVDSSWTQE